MARARLDDVVFQSSVGGSLVADSSSTVYVHVRNAGLATVYAAETGSTLAPNPQTPVASELAGWVDQGSYDIKVFRGSDLIETSPFEAVSGAGGGGRVLNSCGITSPFNTTSASADASGAGLSMVVPVGERPFFIELVGPGMSNTVAGQFCFAEIFEGATRYAYSPLHLSSVGSQQGAVAVKRLLLLTPGNHTIFVKFGRTGFSSSGTASLAATSDGPCSMYATEA